MFILTYTLGKHQKVVNLGPYTGKTVDQVTAIFQKNNPTIKIVDLVRH